MSGKKKLIIIALLFLSVATPASVYLVLREQEIRSQAQPATTVAFDPQSTQVQPIKKTVGETFTLNITIDTGSNNVSGAELHIQYDSAKLTALGISIASNPFLPSVLADGTVVPPGFAFITLGTPPSAPKQGKGVLATVTFRAASPTEGTITQVKFTTDTRVVGTSEAGNLLVSQPAPAFVAINPVSSPPTPTPTSTQPIGGPSISQGNLGIGATIPTTTIQPKGGPITTQPKVATTAPIPTTAELGPTAILSIAGMILFVAGIATLLITRKPRM